LVREWKVRAIVKFKILQRHLPVGTEVSREKGSLFVVLVEIRTT
jgi:hypothetical protein